MARLLPLWLVVFVFAACGAPVESSGLLGNGVDRFPKHPHTDVTPGELCQRPDTYRYPERIAYCERDVSTGTKRAIIEDYDSRFGYTIREMERTEFKIDHFFPLCMGGSNNRANLWPQHRTVYEITDPLEGRLCELMAQGEMTQQEAMETIQRAKFNLDEAPDIAERINARGR